MRLRICCDNNRNFIYFRCDANSCDVLYLRIKVAHTNIFESDVYFDMHANRSNISLGLRNMAGVN